MRRLLIFISILFSVIVSFFIVKCAYAANDDVIEVTSWTSLKNAIENAENSDIKIELSSSISNNWTANESISIKSLQKVTLLPENNKNITIIRQDGFIEPFITSEGNLIIGNDNTTGNLILDGNRDNVEGSSRIIDINSGEFKVHKNLTLRNNNSAKNGGGLFIKNASVTINNSIIENNVGKYGGGIFVSEAESSIELNDVKILNNKATTGSGGGIYAYGNLIINGNNTLISRNNASTYGGGIMAKSMSTFNAGEISNNKALNNSGGGVKVDDFFIMNGGVIKENSAKTTGGGVDCTLSTGVFKFKSGEIINNTAEGEGDNTYPDINDEINIDWTKDESLRIKEINVELAKSYIKGEDLVSGGGLQGMTMTDDYIVFAHRISSEENTRIYIVDKNTFEVKNIITDYCFRHANDMTYNPKTGYIYILCSENRSDKRIAKFKIDNQYNIYDLSYVNIPRYYNAIAYDKEHDYFIGSGYDSNSSRVIYVMDNNFNDLYNFSVDINLTTQGMTYWNDHIYFACHEGGQAGNEYQTVCNYNEKKSNLIFVYDLQGNLERSLYIPNTTLKGEIESIGFYDNGDFLCGYHISLNGKGTISFYKSSNAEVVDNVKITINNDNSAWNNSGVKVDLYQNGVQKATSTVGRGNIASFADMANGTYDVYAGKHSGAKTELIDTGLDITINNNKSIGNIINYYSLQLVKGTGISGTNQTGYTGAKTRYYLYKNSGTQQDIAIDATVSEGYNWEKWTKTSGPNLAVFNEGTKNQNIKIGAGPTVLTANAKVKDTISPIITVNDEDESICKTKKIIITATDEGSGLSSNNSYQYYLSTSSTALSGGTWINYTNGIEFTIGNGITGKRYLFVKRVSDNAENISSKNGTVVSINNEQYQRLGCYNFLTPINIEKMELQLDNNNFTYTGTSIKPNIILKNGNNFLTQNKDYTISFSNNVNIGVATVTVNGIGNYSGKIARNYIIIPTKVSGLESSKQDSYSVTLKWNEMNGVTGYEIYTYDKNQDKYVYIKTVNGNSKKIRELSPKKSYKFKVRAFVIIDNKKYYGAFSDKKKFATGTKKPKINKINSKKRKATIQWNKVSGAKGYKIYMATSKNGEYKWIKNVKNAKTTQYTKSKLKKNKKYYFKIRTYRIVNGKKVYSSYSYVKSIKIL